MDKYIFTFRIVGYLDLSKNLKDFRSYNEKIFSPYFMVNNSQYLVGNTFVRNTRRNF